MNRRPSRLETKAKRLFNMVNITPCSHPVRTYPGLKNLLSSQTSKWFSHFENHYRAPWRTDINPDGKRKIEHIMTCRRQELLYLRAISFVGGQSLEMLNEHFLANKNLLFVSGLPHCFVLLLRESWHHNKLKFDKCFRLNLSQDSITASW